jgi:signal transduction histidine kinase
VEKSVENNDKKLIELFKNISHQWKQPLSQINSIVCTIDAILDEERIRSSEIEKKLSEIELLTQYMAETINTFSNSIIPNKNSSFVDIEDIINQLESIVAMSLKEKNITLELKITQDIQAILNAHELLESLIIIVNNAKDALVDRHVFDAKITISVKRVRDKCSICICDNAGGITQKMMEKIFDKEYTTKHKSQGDGRGLYISKQIITESLNGTLQVKNIDAGSCFKIKFLAI